MIKNLKELFISKTFIVFIILSILLISASFLSYSKNSFNAEFSSIYSIEECKTYEDYETAINNTLEEIEELKRENKKDSERWIRYYEKKVILYKSLRDKGVSYSVCMDDFYNQTQDELVYLNYSTKIISLISVIVVLSAIYVLILKDYTNSAYTIIYQNNRKKVINKKVLLIYIISLVTYVLFFFFNYFIARLFDSDLKYVLSFKDNMVVYITKNQFIFLYLFFSGLFINILLTSIAVALSLFFRNFIIWIITLIALFAIVFLLKSTLLSTFIYLGFKIDFHFVSIDKYFLTTLWQILPISLLFTSMYCFKKADL